MKNYFKNSNYKFSVLIVVLFFNLISCTTKKASEEFKSNFENIPKRTWIGPEYWANPIQDWQLNNNRIECLVSNKNRNIHHLTRQLGEKKGIFEVQVSLGLLNSEITSKNKNWVGFSIGAKGKFDDYRNHTVFDKGLNIGIGTNGSLFIGETNINNKNDAVIKALKKGVDLNVKAIPLNNKYKIEVSLYKIGSKELLSRISKRNVSPENLTGDIVLVSHFDTKKEYNSVYKKSVWFKNWLIKGSKIVNKDEQSLGPILFSQYTLSKNLLKLATQLAPIDHSTKQVEFQIKKEENWETIAKETIDKSNRTATFRIENWNDSVDYNYRLVYNLDEANGKNTDYFLEGVIQKKIAH